jgi:hypothetical protein
MVAGVPSNVVLHPASRTEPHSFRRLREAVEARHAIPLQGEWASADGGNRCWLLWDRATEYVAGRVLRVSAWGAWQVLDYSQHGRPTLLAEDMDIHRAVMMAAEHLRGALTRKRRRVRSGGNSEALPGFVSNISPSGTCYWPSV